MRRVAAGDGDERSRVWVTGITLMMRGLKSTALETRKI
jgi:hypothetical protein